jgi:hypothetical protein
MKAGAGVVVLFVFSIYSLLANCIKVNSLLQQVQLLRN